MTAGQSNMGVGPKGPVPVAGGLFQAAHSKSEIFPSFGHAWPFGCTRELGQPAFADPSFCTQHQLLGPLGWVATLLAPLLGTGEDAVKSAVTWNLLPALLHMALHTNSLQIHAHLPAGWL
jgi:hypothetical protein